MKKRIIRAALMVLAVITVFSVAFFFPSFAENSENAEASTLTSDGGVTEEALASDSLPEVLAGPAGDGGFGGGGDREDGSDEGSSLSKYLYALLRTGGRGFVSSEFNSVITKIRNLFLPLGYCIMFVCWIIGMCKSGMSLNFDPGAKNGILQSGLSLLLCLFLMEVSMEIMESLSALCWEYCSNIPGKTDLKNDIDVVIGLVEGDSTEVWALLQGLWDSIKTLAVTLVSWIIEAVLILNITYMGLLQCFSPIFVGFAAGGEGTRRFATSFFKEYLRVCLVPPVLAVYVALCFELFTVSGVGVFLCLVLGISIFSIGKKIDKIIT